MRALTNTTILSLVLALWVAVAGCVTGASEQELEQACQNLEKLKSGQDPAEAADRLEKCKQDLEKLRVTSDSAQCRAKATDIDGFWNRCR